MQIKDLIGETTEYEKKSRLEIRRPKSWCKSVSAFANSNGGKLIFGITDDDLVLGLEDAEYDAEVISEQIKARLNPIPEFALKFYQTAERKKLIILDIYVGNQTPYYYNADGSLMAYHRVGNQSIPVTPEKLRELTLKGSGFSYDSLKSKYSFGNMAFTKLKSTYNQRTGKQFKDSDYESFGIVDNNNELTKAGALLADESPVRHSRLFCTRWNGLDMAPGVIDAIDDKEYTGGLINLLQDGLGFVINNSKKIWKKTIKGRIEMPDYPEQAVLEGLVNAIIHRNYLEVGSEVHIDMFDDRIEIYSPGGMYDGSQVQDGDIMQIPSRRRNPIIADIFNRLKYMERRGSGFKKIIGDYRKQNYYTADKEPEFYSDYDSFRLVLKNLNYMKKQAVKNRRQKASGKKQAAKTEKNIREIIEYIKIHGEATTRELADYLGLSLSRTRAILAARDEIEPIGESRARVYRLKRDKIISTK